MKVLPRAAPRCHDGRPGIKAQNASHCIVILLQVITSSLLRGLRPKGSLKAVTKCHQHHPRTAISRRLDPKTSIGKHQLPAASKWMGQIEWRPRPKTRVARQQQYRDDDHRGRRRDIEAEVMMLQFLSLLSLALSV